MNSFYLPKSAVEYIVEEFKDRITIEPLNISNDTIKVVFKDRITYEDISNIFFVGAKWTLHYVNKTNSNANS